MLHLVENQRFYPPETMRPGLAMRPSAGGFLIMPSRGSLAAVALYRP
jgi:hypothetical protein